MKNCLLAYSVKELFQLQKNLLHKIKESLAEQFAPESDFKFLSDAKDLLVAKAGELAFPEAILKRFMLSSG
jgi:trigger factor